MSKTIRVGDTTYGDVSRIKFQNADPATSTDEEYVYFNDISESTAIDTDVRVGKIFDGNKEGALDCFGDSAEKKDINFYGMDGGIKYSYTKDEFIRRGFCPDPSPRYVTNPDVIVNYWDSEYWNSLWRPSSSLYYWEYSYSEICEIASKKLPVDVGCKLINKNTNMAITVQSKYDYMKTNDKLLYIADSDSEMDWGVEWTRVSVPSEFKPIDEVSYGYDYESGEVSIDRFTTGELTIINPGMKLWPGKTDDTVYDANKTVGVFMMTTDIIGLNTYSYALHVVLADTTDAVLVFGILPLSAESPSKDQMLAYYMNEHATSGEYVLDISNFACTNCRVAIYSYCPASLELDISKRIFIKGVYIT